MPNEWWHSPVLTQDCNIGRRGDELVVQVVQQVGEGEQLLVECYLEDE